MNINKINRDKYLKYKYKYLQLKGGTPDELDIMEIKNEADFRSYLIRVNNKYRDIIENYKKLYQLYDKKCETHQNIDHEEIDKIQGNLKNIIKVLNKQDQKFKDLLLQSQLQSQPQEQLQPQEKHTQLQPQPQPQQQPQQQPLQEVTDDEKIKQIMESINKDQQEINQLIDVINKLKNYLSYSDIEDQIKLITEKYLSDLEILLQKFILDFIDPNIKIIHGKYDDGNDLLYSLIELCKLNSIDLQFKEPQIIRKKLIEEINRTKSSLLETKKEFNNRDIEQELNRLNTDKEFLGNISLIAFCNLNNLIIEVKNFYEEPLIVLITPIVAKEIEPQRLNGGIVYINYQFKPYIYREKKQ